MNLSRTLTAVLTACVAGAALLSGTASAAPGAAPSDLHTVRSGGVTLTVPADWHLDRSAGPGCIVADSAPAVPAAEKPYGIDDCQLRVLVSGPDLGAPADADDLYFPGDPVVCKQGGASVRWATGLAGTKLMGHASAEYRTFALPCVSHQAEQWFLAGPPGIVMQRTRMLAGTEQAARQAVASAIVPAHLIAYPRSLTGLVSYAGASSIDLAPVRLYRDGHGHTSYNQAWQQSQRIDASTATIVYYDAHENVHELGTATFLRDVRTGFPGVTDGYRAIVNAQSYTGEQLDTITVSVAAQP